MSFDIKVKINPGAKGLTSISVRLASNSQWRSLRRGAKGATAPHHQASKKGVCRKVCRIIAEYFQV